jgi:hypothetical protein
MTDVFTVYNQEFILHKTGHKKESRYDQDIYKENYSATPKVVANVFDR